MVALIKMLYKICIVGDGGVGKTTILHQYVDGKFMEDTKLTIGTNIFLKSIILEEFDISIKLQIWDLGGQKFFASVRRNFYNEAKGIIYTFDLTRKSSLTDLTEWRNEIKKGLKEEFSSVLIGNKLDLINEKDRLINLEDILLTKKELSVSEYFETSAKNNTGIDNAFRKLAIDIFKATTP
jgi:small GTP-binding protein